MTLRVLTWNLMHGRSVPPAGRDLFDRFAAALRGWEWDLALLQEVPPWWPAGLGAAASAQHRVVLTSRNALLPLRRAVATRWPDLIKSNGGGSNAILVRGLSVVEHRVRRLAWLPERRWMHAMLLGNGVWVGNLHAAADPSQGRAAAAALLRWAAGAPVVLGGDFNMRSLSLEGLSVAGRSGVDQVFAGGGLVAGGSAEVLDRGSLSDHAPVAVRVMDLAQ